MDEFKTFLKEYNNELQQSPTSENVHPKIVGNYCLDREDVSNHIIDWVLHYLENRKCPYHLAVAISKNIAKQMDADISEQLLENNVEKEKLLNSFALYTQTFKKLPSVCNTFLEQIDEETCSSSCSLPYTTSVFDIKNKRRTMEDRHVIHHNLNLLLDLKDVPAHSYYAVFDGHSGIDAASYASAHLHVNIAKHPYFLTDTPTAIAQSYKTTDDNFMRKYNEENLKSGTTAVSALIRENKLYLSWVGDSQAVLVKGGKPIFVTEPHKPEREDEKKRVEDLGGSVTFMGVWRVNGLLAITRALGDFDHKPFITSEPEMATIDLDGTEDFLILACDGLWDEMSPEEATAALYHNLSENAVEEPLDAIAAKLVHKSKEQGSEDNITTVVVFLRDIKTIKAYAIELLSQASLQNHFLGMNGDGNHGIESSPCVKPTVLELNSASTKKLKNTANVLSSTGVSYPVFSEGGSDVFQNVNDSSVFVPHHNIACFAPEATALSELPTPPIDDVVASQQFGNLCSAELYEGLNSISTEQSSLVEDETNVFNSGVFDSIVNVQPFCLDNQIPAELHVQNSAMNDFTPDEAADVASCVVSNTIETAVKCLSSNELLEPVIPVSTIKLNPYAKPFIPGETQLQSEFEVTKISDNTTVSQFNLEEDNVVETEISKINLLDDCFKGNESIATQLMKSKTGSTLNSENLEKIQKNEKESPDNLSFLTSEFADLTLNSPQTTSGTKVENKSIEQDYLLEAISGSEIVENQTSIIHNVPDSPKEPEHLNQVLESPQSPIELDLHAVKSTGIDSVSVKEEIKSVEENVGGIGAQEDVSKFEKMTMDIHGDDHIKTNEKASTLIQDIVDPIPKHHTIELTGECSIPKEMSLDKLASRDCVSEILFEPEIHVDENTSKASESVENYDVSSEACVILPDSEKTINDEIQSTELVCENFVNSVLEEKCVSPVKVSDVGIALEDIAFGSLNIVNINKELTSAQVALPSDSADEGPVETVAVDLQTIPVGVPEAEGVTEDVDSDSEKDGGWSYMKGNIIGGKSKTDELSKSNVEKSEGKLDAVSKLKKDAPKAISDSKIKVRSLTSTDKTKKPQLEKKGLEAKDKIRPARTVSSTLPRDSSKATLPKTNLDKSSKSVSTFVRAKKEISTTALASKPSTTATLKPSRPTTLRNPAPVAKPGAPLNTERSGAVKTTSNVTVGNIRPKSALSTNPAKAPSRPPTLSKSQPQNQSKAPSARSTTLSRPIVSTVPTRALNKPSSLSKPTCPESKVKPSVSTLKKAELKKPDVKETKDIVNKQISARKNVTTSTIIRSETTKSATTSTKSAITLSNKSVPSKTRSAPVKTDVNKKDVPKSGMSRLAPKANNPIKKSPNAAKSNAKKPLLDQDKVENPNLATAGKQSSTTITPTSEEEKCILEVHDKEVMSTEEKGEIVDQKHTCLENGISESIKPLEETVASTNEVNCNAQIL